MSKNWSPTELPNWFKGWVLYLVVYGWVQDKEPLRRFEKSRCYSWSQVSDLGAIYPHQAKPTCKITNNKKSPKNESKYFRGKHLEWNMGRMVLTKLLWTIIGIDQVINQNIWYNSHTTKTKKGNRLGEMDEDETTICNQNLK